MFIRVPTGRRRGEMTLNVMNIESYGAADGGGVMLYMNSGAQHQVQTDVEHIDRLITRVKGITINKPQEDLPDPTPILRPVDPSEDTHTAPSIVPDKGE